MTSRSASTAGITWSPICRSPSISARRGGAGVTDLHTPAYRKAGANLAANVFAMLRLDDFRARTAESPYPRLRNLLAALKDAEIVADGRGFRFADPVTGKEIWLADVP